MKKLCIRPYTLKKISTVCEVETKEVHLNRGRAYVTIETEKSLNTSKERYITHNTRGEFYVKNINNPSDESIKIKLGKIIQQISNKKLTSTEIEKAVNKWKSIYTIDTSCVKVSKDIQGVYNISECGGSCMANKGSYMAIYEDFGCKVAYLLDEYGDLKARAILWHNINKQDIETERVSKVSVMDRIFYNNEVDKLTLLKWTEENGYETFNKKSFVYYTETISFDKYTKGVPYLDTLCYLFDDSCNMFLCSDDEQISDLSWSMDILHGTEGASDEKVFGITGVFCEDVQTYISEEEALWVEDLNCYYTEGNPDVCWIEAWEGYYSICNEDIAFCVDSGRYVPKEEAFYVADIEEWYEYNGALYFEESCQEWVMDEELLCNPEDDEAGCYYKENCCYIYNVDEWYYVEEAYKHRIQELKDKK